MKWDMLWLCNVPSVVFKVLQLLRPLTDVEDGLSGIRDKEKAKHLQGQNWKSQSTYFWNGRSKLMRWKQKKSRWKRNNLRNAWENTWNQLRRSKLRYGTSTILWRRNRQRWSSYGWAFSSNLFIYRLPCSSSMPCPTWCLWRATDRTGRRASPGTRQCTTGTSTSAAETTVPLKWSLQYIYMYCIYLQVCILYFVHAIIWMDEQGEFNIDLF